MNGVQPVSKQDSGLRCVTTTLRVGSLAAPMAGRASLGSNVVDPAVRRLSPRPYTTGWTCTLLSVGYVRSTVNGTTAYCRKMTKALLFLLRARRLQF